ncbi:helix-turn-helix domain-containing protein [Halovenus salina]|uniref:Helix-turn-helix domain-containing protein n=1 Tax=Halovenus salina TaxID=1510225 RepID=A0ABD5VZL6_9EURY
MELSAPLSHPRLPLDVPGALSRGRPSARYQTDLQPHHARGRAVVWSHDPAAKDPGSGRREGYYSLPRQASTQELAETFDVSDQAITERLRRAIEMLVTNTLLLTADDDDD